MTPSHLKTLRILLGLQPSEVGDLLGGILGPQVKDLESPRIDFVFQQHIDVLMDLNSKANAWLLSMLDIKDDVLIIYPNEDVFRQYEPSMNWMPSNGFHQALVARLLDAHMQDGHMPIIMQLAPTRYEAYLNHNSLSDNEESRQRWAKANMKTQKVRTDFRVKKMEEV